MMTNATVLTLVSTFRKFILTAGAALLAVTSLSAAAADQNAGTRWMEETLQSVIESNIGTFGAGRAYAMATVAMYDAVNGIDRQANFGPRRDHALVSPHGAPNNANRSVAVAAAAHAVLSHLFPARQHALDAALQEAIFLADDNANRIHRGLAWGEFVGNEVVALRAHDGVQAPDIMLSGGGVGEFHVDADVRFRNLEAFGVADPEAYVSEHGPPALTSGEYAASLFQIVAQGGPDGRPENDALAAFWRFGSGTVQETGSWPLITLALARQEGTVHSLSDTVRLLALMGMAMSDSVAVTAREKAEFFFWRPITAIQRANEDGNPLTDLVFDPNFTTRFGQVGASPEWTSGQSTFAGAGSTVLSEWFCKDDIAFTFNALTGQADRSYASFREAADEAVFSRVLQGIHFTFTNTPSLHAGRDIATEIVRSRLQRLDHKPDIVQFCPQF